VGDRLCTQDAPADLLAAVRRHSSHLVKMTPGTVALIVDGDGIHVPNPEVTGEESRATVGQLLRDMADAYSYRCPEFLEAAAKISAEPSHASAIWVVMIRTRDGYPVGFVATSMRVERFEGPPAAAFLRTATVGKA
jgi:hypothetical protein